MLFQCIIRLIHFIAYNAIKKYFTETVIYDICVIYALSLFIFILSLIKKVLFAVLLVKICLQKCLFYICTDII